MTFADTQKETSSDGHKLVAPGACSRCEVRDFIQGAVAATQSNRAQPLGLTYMSVFQERHASGRIHYHAALLGDKCFRFLTVKRHLLQAHGLASHWSGKSDGYAGCVAYCYLPSPTKAVEQLDPAPEVWPATHPPLSEASRAPCNAKAMEEFREGQRRRRAQEGKSEARWREVDLWPIVVRENIAPDEICGEKLMAYAKRCGGRAMVEYCFANWDKLPGIVAKSWQVEKVETFVETAQKSRLELLQEALQQDCVCQGQWGSFANTILSQNGHDVAEWRQAMTNSLATGREKGNVVCHAGFEGNEGKSFLLRPLPQIYGEGGVFVTPPKSAFPAMSSVHVQHVDCVFLAWARQDAVRVSAQPQLGLSLEHCCGKREVVGGDQTLTAGVWRTDSPEPRVAKCISA